MLFNCVAGGKNVRVARSLLVINPEATSFTDAKPSFSSEFVIRGYSGSRDHEACWQNTAIGQNNCVSRDFFSLGIHFENYAIFN